MQSKLIACGLLVAAGVLGAFGYLAVTRAAVDAQSLLTNWVFAQSRGLVPIEQLKASRDGRLISPEHPLIPREGQEIWSVQDKRNCVLRMENPSLELVAYFYLNNMSRIRPTVYKPDGSFQISLMGNDPVYCQYHQGEQSCSHLTTILSSSAETHRAIEQALNYIYANFCRYESAPTKLQ